MTAVLKQTRFTLPIADSVRLVAMETVRAGLGETAEVITDWIEDHVSANHLPGFNLAVRIDSNSASGRHAVTRRELHVWAGALRNSSVTDLDAIIADCLLTNLQGLDKADFYLPSTRLEEAWVVSNQHILRLIQAGELPGHKVGRNGKVNRAGAAAFLRRRAI